MDGHILTPYASTVISSIKVALSNVVITRIRQGLAIHDNVTGLEIGSWSQHGGLVRKHHVGSHVDMTIVAVRA